MIFLEAPSTILDTFKDLYYSKCFLGGGGNNPIPIFAYLCVFM